MSERIIWTAGMVALLAAPLMAETGAPKCQPLPEGFALCLESSDWAEAEFFAFENGIALEMGDIWMEFSAAPESLQELSPFDAALPALQELLAAESQLEGLEAPETLADAHDLAGLLDLISVTTRVALPEDEPMVFVSAIADHPQGRLLLTLDIDAATEPSELDATLRRIAAQIRPLEDG